MSAARGVAAVALISLLFLVGEAPAAKGKKKPPPAPTRVLVTADEWSLILSRPKVYRGPALIELYNFGEDPHDLRLQTKGGPLYSLPETGPGDGGRVEARLKRGRRYQLWCSLPGHRQLGMAATLKVAKKKRRPR